MYIIKYADSANKELKTLLKKKQKKKLNKIREAIAKLRENPRHPGLHTHTNKSYKNQEGRQTFQSYVENKTPGAFRIFWYYGPGENMITIFAITPHP